MRCKGVVCIVIVFVLLCSFALPCFASEVPSAEEPRHIINVHIPYAVYYVNNGQGTSENNWDVEYYTETYEGYVFEEYDSEYQITIYQTNYYNYQFNEYQSITTCSIYLVDAPRETREEYTYTSEDVIHRVTGISLRENGTVYPLEELHHNMLTDGSVESSYQYSFRVKQEKGKSLTVNLWLYMPSYSYNFEEDTISDEELIQQLLKEYAGKIDISDPQQAISQFGIVVNTITNGFPLINTWLLTILAIALIALILFGRSR